ncbi:MAG TPA: oxidoreductase, partial [Exiguobacterium sp.]|nr:oxidoreductase [Exiguobacterium sp.]
MAIQGKVIIITGASSGIGEATARLLARQGAKLVLSSRRNDRMAKLVDSIQADGEKVIYQETDVVKLEDNQRLIKAALTAYGRIDAIFLNAGLMPSSPLSALQVDEWNRMIDVNLKGVLNGIAAVMPTFTSQRAG